MLSYLEIALINAVMILPLALVAEASGRLIRRPALTHLLWVLILVKLITPPIWQIPLLDRDWVKFASRQMMPDVLTNENFELGPRLFHLSDESFSLTKTKARPRTLASQDKRPGVAQVSITSMAVRTIRSEGFWQLLQAGLLVAWSLGALLWFTIQGARCLRFRWSLQNGYAAGPELQRFSDRLARRLGLSYSPTVWLMPGVMSPMLWGNGQSLLLIFPERMLDRLNDAAMGTLLTHELAHYRRRDHWVRVIALLSSGFFWWHPVVWWARREIEKAEEECCDALVVASAAAAPKCYAEAILEVIDFLTERQSRLPALATGLGQVPFLRQRLTWIMRGPRRREIGYCGRVLSLMSACMLPLQPSWLPARTPVAIPHVGPVDQNQLSPAPRIHGRILEFPKSTQPDDLNDPVSALEGPSRWNRLEVKSHSSDGRFVVMGNPSTLCLFDFKNGREFDLDDFVIQSMAFAQNSPEFVTVGSDGFLRLWNAEACEVVRAWRVPAGSTRAVDISSDGEWIATGGQDGVIRIWNRTSSQPIEELPPELVSINSICISPNQETLAVATGNGMTPQTTGRIAIYSTRTWNELNSMNWNSPTSAVVFQDEGRTLVSGDGQGRVARWNVNSGELLGLSDGHQNLVATAQFSPSGSSLKEVAIPDLPVTHRWSETETINSVRDLSNSVRNLSRNWWPVSATSSVLAKP